MRSLIIHFAIINIKIRFKGTYLGLLWTAIEPTLTFILLYIVFTSLRVRDDNFAIYLLTGIIIYHVFTRGTLAGLASLRGNRNIIKSLNIRNEIYPVMTTAATALLVFVQVGVFFGLMPFFHFIPPWTVVLLPIVIALVLLLTLGFSYILSIINVYVRDVQPLWTVIIHAVFFVTPIFWYLDNAQGILLEIHKFNPIGQIIELGHKIVVYGQIPPLADWLYTGLFVFAILIVGYALFQKYESRIAEEL